MAAKRDRKNPRLQALIEEGTLNPAPEKIKDPKFLGGEFFDPHDIVQVKYEMLRRVSVEKAPVTGATGEYGVSRPTYYQAKARPTGATQGAGRSAAVYPGTSGCWQAYSGPSTGQTDSEKISSRYPPEDDRARSKKNLAVKPRSDGLAERLSDVVAQYETLRDAALARALAPEARSGLLIFLRRGLWGWARVLAASRASPPPEPRPLLSFSAGEESRDVIHILAAIAIGAERRGATP